MKLPAEIRMQFQDYGRTGGRRRARKLTPETRRRIATTAGMARWIRRRFGKPNFEALGVPGGALIDKGLQDYAAGNPSPEACLVALAAPRLRREGVPVPQPAPGWKTLVVDPYRSLYLDIAKKDGDLAHSRYNAYLQQAVSFADALAQTR